MLEAKEIIIDNRKFVLNPLKGFKALKLDKKVVGLLLPLIKGVESLDADINFGEALSGLSDAITSLPDNEYEQFVSDLLSTVQYLPEGQQPVEITTSVIDSHFQGATMTLYNLMFEVMKYNNFTPFALVSKVGGGTLKTLISEKLTSGMES